MEKHKKQQKHTEQTEKTIEVEDATTEAAIQKALKVLKAKKEEVKITVLKEEHKGLFGMEGANRAHIRATQKPAK